MCGPQLRSSSIIIPRNLVEQTFSNLVSSMKIDLDLSFSSANGLTRAQVSSLSLVGMKCT